MTHIKRLVQAIGRHSPKRNRGLHNADIYIPRWWIDRFDNTNKRLPRPSWDTKK